MIKNSRFMRLALIGGPIGLLLGLLAGLMRMDVFTHSVLNPLALSHGYLMINGFLLTVISFERAVALKTASAYLVPFSSTFALFLLLAGQTDASLAVFSFSAVLFTIVYVRLYFKTRELSVLLMGLGAMLLAIANISIASREVFSSSLFLLMGFPLFTILGERIELSRLSQVSRLQYVLVVAVTAAFLLGSYLSISFHPLANQVLGASFVALSLLFLKMDIARRTVRAGGITRFIAMYVLHAYAWLFITGILLLRTDAMMVAGFEYDAVIHAFFLGFMFSMIFAHAPMILPAVLNLKVVFSSWLYLPVILLNFSLLGRLYADMTENLLIRQYCGILNAVAIVLFFTAYALIRLLIPPFLQREGKSSR